MGHLLTVAMIRSPLEGRRNAAYYKPPPTPHSRPPPTTPPEAGARANRVARRQLPGVAMALCHAQNESAGPTFPWFQAVATVGRPHCQELCGSAMSVGCRGRLSWLFSFARRDGGGKHDSLRSRRDLNPSHGDYHCEPGSEDLMARPAIPELFFFLPRLGLRGAHS